LIIFFPLFEYVFIKKKTWVIKKYIAECRHPQYNFTDVRLCYRCRHS